MKITLEISEEEFRLLGSHHQDLLIKFIKLPELVEWHTNKRKEDFKCNSEILRKKREAATGLDWL
jgi:hypothetical protein